MENSLSKFKIELSAQLKSRIPELKLSYLLFDVLSDCNNYNLDKEFSEIVYQIGNTVELNQISSINNIFYTRQAYKLLGKEPSRYRPAAEALYRRIVRNKGLYRINDLVDSVNIISLNTAISIGLYDFNKIKGSIIADIGRASDLYMGIGKEQLNIENMPALRDSEGFFGNPSSDSQRTMVNYSTSRALMIMWVFSDLIDAEKSLNYSIEKLKLFFNIAILDSGTVK